MIATPSPDQAPTPMSHLSTDLDAYLTERAATDWSPRSVQHHRSILRRLCLHLATLGHRRWSNVTAADLDGFMLELADLGRTRNSLDSYAWSLRGFGAWLLKRGKVLCNPAADLRTMEAGEEPLPPPPLSEAQVADLINAIPADSVVGLRNRLHLHLLYACGLRNAEAVNLDVGDLVAPALHVRGGKGGVDRVQGMVPTTVDAANAYLAVRRDLLTGPDHGALLLSPRGDRLGAWHMQRLLSSASATLGFRVHPHLLRHSIAVHLLRRGMDVRLVQMFLGHASLETTKVYLRLVPGHLREDYDKAMPNLLPNLPWKPPGEGAGPVPT